MPVDAGTGALNLTTGADYALLGGTPMILLTGQKGILSRPQAGFQLVDTVATMAPLTKRSQQIVSASSIPSLVRDAFRLAREERPGSVHLELPEDIAAEKVKQAAPVPPHDYARAVAPAEAVEAAAVLLLKADARC